MTDNNVDSGAEEIQQPPEEEQPKRPRGRPKGSKSKTGPKKPVPIEDMPNWMRLLPKEERDEYLQSDNCLVCTAIGKDPTNKEVEFSIRYEIETMYIRKDLSLTKLSDAIYERYGAMVPPLAIDYHMKAHAATYKLASQRIMNSETGRLIANEYPELVDQYKVMRILMEKGFDDVLSGRSGPIKPETWEKAAKDYHTITQGIEIKGDVSQDEINAMIEALASLSPGLRAEAYRRFSRIRAGLPINMGEVIESNYIEEEGSVPLLPQKQEVEAEVEEGEWEIIEGLEVSIPKNPPLDDTWIEPEEDGLGSETEDKLERAIEAAISTDLQDNKEAKNESEEQSVPIEPVIEKSQQPVELPPNCIVVDGEVIDVGKLNFLDNNEDFS